jgi:hypothetical protein
MSETIRVVRNRNREPVLAAEIVHSPDDGGYYVAETDFEKKRHRVSRKIYKMYGVARDDYHAGLVKWEPWY